jgi:hypothetical protein
MEDQVRQDLEKAYDLIHSIVMSVDRYMSLNSRQREALEFIDSDLDDILKEKD